MKLEASICFTLLSSSSWLDTATSISLVVLNLSEKVKIGKVRMAYIKVSESL